MVAKSSPAVKSGSTSGIKRAAQFVTVACKLPQGIRIHVEGREAPYHFHGTKSPFARFGYGMTDVPAEVWEQITKQYGQRKGHDRNGKPCLIPEATWLANRIVFAASAPEDVNAEAKDREKLKVGFEAVDPKKPEDTPGASIIQREGAEDPGLPAGME